MRFWCLGAIAAFVGPGIADGWNYRTSMALFDNSSCASPASVVAFPYGFPQCTTPQTDHFDPECADDGVSFTVTDCVYYSLGGSTSYGLLREYFGDAVPYLVVEEYLSRWTTTCNVWWNWYLGYEYGLGDATAYRLDEDCHTSFDGRLSTRLTLGQTLTITKYYDPDCNFVLSWQEVT
ncbi:hypothetical protein PHYPSEUDO_002755 [Phytophthora pseudosyringae]|uniref:Uncharacterized protein n=1 Tax=Phytophthora pseudosyringae TaxID=221518 RepID=A0A8T1VVT4_9STRA|nr:hypothetical protein PHYPSEUDO_002755 [Phytophthora pseudosyringae]